MLSSPAPRIRWRADQPATIYWVKAADGGDPKAKAAVRDRVYTLEAPFTAEAKSIADLEIRYRGIAWAMSISPCCFRAAGRIAKPSSPRSTRPRASLPSFIKAPCRIAIMTRAAPCSSATRKVFRSFRRP